MTMCFCSIHPVVSLPYVGECVFHTFTTNGTLTLPSLLHADALVVCGIWLRRWHESSEQHDYAGNYERHVLFPSPATAVDGGLDMICF
jgi:hypothetical protein